jgi:hypothetical protein
LRCQDFHGRRPSGRGSLYTGRGAESSIAARPRRPHVDTRATGQR